MDSAAHKGNAQFVYQGTAGAVEGARRERAASDREGHDSGITELSAPHHAGKRTISPPS